jgi:hypothetical protein
MCPGSLTLSYTFLNRTINCIPIGQTWEGGAMGRVELQKFSRGNILILTIYILLFKATGMLFHLLRLDLIEMSILLTLTNVSSAAELTLAQISLF